MFLVTEPVCVKKRALFLLRIQHYLKLLITALVRNGVFQNLKLTSTTCADRRKSIKEIGERLKFLVNVGLNYLSLSRSADTLSGGEAQRIRLASQIGAGLVGVMYVLDEPSIGLHQRDNDRLLETLIHLRNLGNTVIVVEHDEDAIRAADHVIDIGIGRCTWWASCRSRHIK